MDIRINSPKKAVEAAIKRPICLTTTDLEGKVAYANTQEEALGYLLDQLRSFGYERAVEAYLSRETKA